MPAKGNRSGPSAQLRSHSRSSSATRVGANLQFTQKDNASAKGSDKGKKNLHALHEGGRPDFTRANSSQRVPLKRAGSSTSTTQQAKGISNANVNTAKANANFTLTTRTTDEDDDDEWVSSSGAQTPNRNDPKSETTSEGSSIPQELVQQLQHTQMEQQRLEEAAAARGQTPLPRVETARQSDFNPATGTTVAPSNPNVAPKSAPLVPTQTPFPTDDSESNGPSMDSVERSSHQHHKSQSQPSPVDHALAPSGTGGQEQQYVKETNHSRSESRPTHTKRQSITRPTSTHSMSSRLDSVPMRPHPLIRGHSQGYLNLVPKPTPLAPLTVITDQPTGAPDGQLSGSPESIKTNVTSPGGYTASFPSERRTSFSSARSVATLPVHNTAQPPHKPYDRTRTLSTMSTTVSSTALNSLAHLPSITRPPSPQLISFFPPVNPHVNIEAIHPLLPGPYLNNHLTVLARRTPLRESYDRVTQAKIASGR